jgi:LMBR1-like membrane protein
MIDVIRQILNMLLLKYRKLDKDGLELYYLSEIHSLMPTHIVIEIECKYKKTQELIDKYLEVVKKNLENVLSFHDIVNFSSGLKHLVYRYNLNKSKYREMVADAVYYDNVLTSIENHQSTLPKTIIGFYGKNWLFKTFPRFGIFQIITELYWFSKLYQPYRVIEILITCALSLFLFLLEQTFFFRREIILKLLTYFPNDDPFTPGRILLILSAVMSYMIYVCFIGVFSVKVFGYYEFYRENTTPSTLLNSAFYILKFTPPICFNLLDISLGKSAYLEKTAFYNVRYIPYCRASAI